MLKEKILNGLLLLAVTGMIVVPIYQYEEDYSKAHEKHMQVYEDYLNDLSKSN